MNLYVKTIPDMQRKYLVSIIVISTIAVGLIGAAVLDFNTSQNTEKKTATSTATTTRQLVNLYYYSPEKDIDDSGELRCSTAGLTATPYHLPKGPNIISKTIELLLAGAGEKVDHPSMITGFPLPELSLVGVHLRDGVAVVALDDPAEATSGDDCRARVLREQLRATILQFPSVAEVEFIPDSLFRS